MRIWMVNHYALAPSEAGGTRHYSLARKLIKRGHDVVIFASSFRHGGGFQSRLGVGEKSKIEEIGGVRFVWLQTPGYRGNGVARFWGMVIFGWRVLVTAAGLGLAKPDVVIGSSPHPFAALGAERLASKLRVPFILEVRDIWPQTLLELGRFPQWHPLIWGLAQIERYLYKRSCRIISLLPGAREHMVSKGATADKVVWIPNGVDGDIAANRPVRPRQGPFTFMFAGAHGVANGLDRVLDAVGQLQKEGLTDRIRVRLIGDGPEKLRLNRRVEEEGLSAISMEAPVPKREIYSVMGEADAFVMVLTDSPVFQWGVSPNKLYDYMVVGRPVLFAVNTPFDPVAQSGAGISVRANDAHTLADAMKQLIDCSHQELLAMGERGRSYVMEQHSFDRLAERLEQTLLSVVD